MDSLSPLTVPAGRPVGMRSGYSQIVPAANAAASTKAQSEFMTIFYKELLKQVFKTPNFSVADEEEKRSGFASFNSDMMVEQLAELLAAKQSWVLSSQQLLGSAESRADE